MANVRSLPGCGIVSPIEVSIRGGPFQQKGSCKIANGPPFVYWDLREESKSDRVDSRY